MANASFLLEYNFDFNPLLQQTFHLPPLRSFLIKSSYGGNYNALKSKYPSYKGIGDYPKLRTKCFIMTHIPNGNSGIAVSGGWKENDLQAVAISSGMDESLRTSIKNIVKASLKPVITGVLLGFLLLYDYHHSCVALAASVGVGPAVGVKPLFGSALGFLNYFLIPVMMINILSDIRKILKYFSTQKTSILKLQVGLLGTGKSLQEDLNRISKAYHTQLREGLSYVLQETTVSLLRHREYCISGYSSVYIKRSREDVQNRFNQLCIEERGKSDVETLVNVNNIGELSATTERSINFRNEYIVVTIIVGAKGGHTLPPINSSADLKEALQKLACIPLGRVDALAVLLTPQNGKDTMTERKFLENYSLLGPL